MKIQMLYYNNTIIVGHRNFRLIKIVPKTLKSTKSPPKRSKISPAANFWDILGHFLGDETIGAFFRGFYFDF